MQILETHELALPEVKSVSYARFADERGYFTETFRRAQLEEVLGIPGGEVLQINESFSRAGVFRGLHAQWNPYQGKLIRAVTGRLVDLAVDLRKGSLTFGKLVAFELDADPANPTGEWIWIPPGFVHGAWFPEATTIEYLCTGAWSPGCEISISPLAEDLDWSLCEPRLAEEVRGALSQDALLTEKDRHGFTLGAWLADPRSDWFVHAPGEPWETTSRIEA